MVDLAEELAAEPEAAPAPGEAVARVARACGNRWPGLAGAAELAAEAEVSVVEVVPVVEVELAVAAE